MDIYWSRIPKLPRKLYWPVRVVSWGDEHRHSPIKVFCYTDNAIISVSRDQLKAFPGPYDELKQQGIAILKGKKQLQTLRIFELDLEWALDKVRDDRNGKETRDDSGNMSQEVAEENNDGDPIEDVSDCNDEHVLSLMEKDYVEATTNSISEDNMDGDPDDHVSDSNAILTGKKQLQTSRIFELDLEWALDKVRDDRNGKETHDDSGNMSQEVAEENNDGDLIEDVSDCNDEHVLSLTEKDYVEATTNSISEDDMDGDPDDHVSDSNGESLPSLMEKDSVEATTDNNFECNNDGDPDDHVSGSDEQNVPTLMEKDPLEATTSSISEENDDGDPDDHVSDSNESSTSIQWPMLHQTIEEKTLPEMEKVHDINYPNIYVRKVLFSKDKNNNKKRVQNSCHACFYCGKLRSHIQDHLNRTHASEQEVKTILECNDINKKEELKSLLRAKGDHKHNREVVYKKCGELLLYRRPTEGFKHEEFGPCIECLEWMKTTSICKHLKTCRGDSSDFVRKLRYVSTLSNVAKGKKPRHGSDALIKEVFTIMTNDEIGLEARDDELICSLGEIWMKSCVDNKVKRAHWTSQHMRLAAKLLIELRKLDDSGENLQMWDYLRPKYFDNLISASISICLPEMDDVEELRSPSNAIKMKYDLIRMLECKSIKSGQRFDETSEEKWKKFRKESESVLTDMQRSWKTKVTKVARKVLLERKLGKKEKMPSPKDIEKLGCDIKQFLTDADLDSETITWNEFRKLCEFAQARLLTYNKRRSGEIEGITIKNYRHKLKIDDLDEGLIGEITQLERHLMETHDLIQTRGKKGGIVPVLIPQECKQVLDFIADTVVRKKLMIPGSNIYLFPQQKDLGPIRAYDSLKKVCRMSELQEPENITSTTLRKYMATLAQVMNLSSNEMEQICRHLGHTAKVHLTHYRAMSPYIERVKLGKILLMQDLNIQSRFVGKKPEDIDFYDIINPERIENAEENNEEQQMDTQHTDTNEEQLEMEVENEDISEMSDSELEMRKPQKKSKKGTKQRWSAEEERELRTYFRKNFENKKTPRMAEVLKAKTASMKAGGIIHKRHWHVIVKKVSATIIKEKKNLGSKS